ncbi:hypothetical protein [Paenibacillus hubeiensis]|uniref:hypothetical protein n=1 Tax=Paenibacillus hubeiensis TaxID=3077330 RepID=UPI0031BB924A
MSYDLMVFDTKAAPQSREGFLAWYDKQTEWSEGHTYKDITVSAERLQRFYEDMVQVFPSMDVDDETFEAMEEEGTDNRLTEYSIGRHIIYVAFAWSRQKRHMRQCERWQPNTKSAFLM